VSYSSSSSSIDWKIPVIIGVVLVGILVIAGGIWLMVSSFNSSSAPRRRRRPVYRDDY
jgi:hypothetical protein